MNINILNIPQCFSTQEKVEATVHAHDYYQLMWFWQGVGCHHIDFADEVLQSGRIFVVSPGQLHQFKPCEKTEGIIIQFDDSFFTQEGNKLENIIKYDVFNVFDRPPYYLISDQTADRLRGIAEEIKREALDNDKFAHDQYIHNLVKMFLIILIREGLRNDHEQIYNNSAACLNFVNFRKELDRNYRRCHTVHEYASMLGMSVKTLTNSTLKCSGLAPLKIINNRLIVEAKRMLMSTPKLVKEIAYELGFDDDSYFVKFFRRQVGMLPTEFREKEKVNKIIYY
ncbi:MAG: AraC family transcriptional regulator [Prevotella sp.]|nr:AraC family transcriptional regulator [Prevotella sp.]